MSGWINTSVRCEIVLNCLLQLYLVFNQSSLHTLLPVVDTDSNNHYLVTRDSCSQHCVPSALWSYQVGREYTYDYQVEAISSMKGTTDEESSLMIEAKVTFQLLSPCNFLLKV